MKKAGSVTDLSKSSRLLLSKTYSTSNIINNNNNNISIAAAAMSSSEISGPSIKKEDDNLRTPASVASLRAESRKERQKELGDLDSDDEDKARKPRKSLFGMNMMFSSSQSNLNFDPFDAMVTKPAGMMVKGVKGTGSLMKTGVNASITGAGTVVKGTGTLVGVGISGAGTVVKGTGSLVGAGINTVGAGMKMAGDGLGLSSTHGKTTKEEELVKKFFDANSQSVSSADGSFASEAGNNREVKKDGSLLDDLLAEGEGKEDDELTKKRMQRRRRKSGDHKQRSESARQPRREGRRASIRDGARSPNSNRASHSAEAADGETKTTRRERSTRGARSLDVNDPEGGKSRAERGLGGRRDRSSRTVRTTDSDPAATPDAEPSPTPRPRRSSQRTIDLGDGQDGGRRTRRGPRMVLDGAGNERIPRRHRSSGNMVELALRQSNNSSDGPQLSRNNSINSDTNTKGQPMFRRTNTGTKVKVRRQNSVGSNASNGDDKSTISQRLESELRVSKSQSKLKGGADRERERGVRRNRSASSAGLAMMQTVANAGDLEAQRRRNRSASMANMRLALGNKDNNTDDGAAKGKNANATFGSAQRIRSANVFGSEPLNVAATLTPAAKKDTANAVFEANKQPKARRSTSGQLLELLGPLAPSFGKSRSKKSIAEPPSEELDVKPAEATATMMKPSPSISSIGSSVVEGGAITPQKIARKPSRTNVRQTSRTERRDRGERRSRNKKQSSNRSVRSPKEDPEPEPEPQVVREDVQEESTKEKMPQGTGNEDDLTGPRETEEENLKESADQVSSIPGTISVEKPAGRGSKSNGSGETAITNETSLSTGEEDPLDDMTPVPTPEQQRYWKCVCGELNEKVFKFCGMCRASQLWTCSDCGFELNKCRFLYCGACASPKNVCISSVLY